MEIIVTNPDYNGLDCRLGVDETLTFGRDVGGVGHLGEHPTISRQHGVIVVTEIGFTVEATGTFSGVTVIDHTTPSRLHIPNGVGPIDIPFRSCAVAVDSEGGAARLDVLVTDSSRADAWAEQWGIDAAPRPRPRNGRGVTTRTGRRANVRRFRKANGVYYAWFTVLVALCEPELTDAVPVAPTNEQLAERTGFSIGNIEKKMAAVYEAFDVDAANTERPRDVVIQRAVTVGIVTREHLDLLPPDVPGSRRLR